MEIGSTAWFMIGFALGGYNSLMLFKNLQTFSRDSHRPGYWFLIVLGMVTGPALLMWMVYRVMFTV